MPKKKTVTPDEQHMETMTAAETDGEDANADLFLEDVSALESAVDDFPANNESHFPEVDAPPHPSSPRRVWGRRAAAPSTGRCFKNRVRLARKKPVRRSP